jgi:cytochrome c5
VNGAPKIGDKEDWIPRLKPGLDIVVRSAINGHGAMPPRGGMANLTDAEIRSAIIYMFNADAAPTKAPPKE